MEELYNKLRILKQEQKDVSNKITEEYSNNNHNKLQKNQVLKELYDKSRLLLKEIRKLEIEISFLKPPIKTNGVIDIRNASDYEYLVYLHNTNTLVGEFTYYGKHLSTGDIGGYILENYRGNNYCYQSLVLIIEKLCEDGIPDLWLCAENDNLPSIKSIQKLNPKIIKQEKVATLFECETRKREEGLTPIKR